MLQLPIRQQLLKVKSISKINSSLEYFLNYKPKMIPQPVFRLLNRVDVAFLPGILIGQKTIRMASCCVQFLNIKPMLTD